MLETGGSSRDLISFVLPQTGALVEVANPAQPYVLLDAGGVVVEPVSAFFAELQACSRPPSTIRSYGMDLLRWWRFLHAVGVEWHRATRLEARDFARWMAIAPKPVRAHWRGRTAGAKARPAVGSSAGVPNMVTGRAGPGPMFATTRAHCETVLRSFYDFHLDADTGPIINPFPTRRERRQLPASVGGPDLRAGRVIRSLTVTAALSLAGRLGDPPGKGVLELKRC
ncbi:site-specific integrase [Streptomyces sp. NPDC016459]|uniref:site-specific integrase n=1 Tax=unclassified Streptomyces TaxID=2593676 RepID=UPI00339E7D56